jgi:NTP pyrophosphatase (non-canonical NTP hydrolase)
MTDEFEPLTVDEYARRAGRTDQRSDGGSMAFPLLGLFGETGSLLSEVKKKQRDRASYLGYAEAVVEELGDVLWYLAAVTSRAGARLSEVFVSAAPERVKSAADGLPLFSLQPEVMPRSGDPSPAFERTLLKLAGQVGLLVSEASSSDASDTERRLVAVARTIIQAADEAGVTLEAAAVKNLLKIEDRWPLQRRLPDLFDDHAELDERLPRQLTIEIFERQVRGQTYVFQRCNSVNIGDRLTDNAMTADDYRFHDVFHYAYVAVLGWSPVIRALLRLKRKSLPAIDEAQDGARATLIEEGIATWIFGRAVQLNLFETMSAGDLPFDLLKQVRQFVAGYEAEQCPLWLWEEAILQGYSAFRFLRQHRRGRVCVDMCSRQLSVEELH